MGTSSRSNKRYDAVTFLFYSECVMRILSTDASSFFLSFLSMHKCDMVIYCYKINLAITFLFLFSNVTC